jgi:hypothetical protein
MWLPEENGIRVSILMTGTIHFPIPEQIIIAIAIIITVIAPMGLIDGMGHHGMVITIDIMVHEDRGVLRKAGMIPRERMISHKHGIKY